METIYLDGRFQRQFKTKKALKEAVKEGRRVEVHSEAMFGSAAVPDGKHALVGPGPYERKWYATATVEGGVITGIK